MPPIRLTPLRPMLIALTSCVLWLSTAQVGAVNLKKAEEVLKKLEAGQLDNAATDDQLHWGWRHLRSLLSKPTHKDVRGWRLTGRLALQISDQNRPISGKELATVAGEALKRLEPEASADLIQQLTELAGERAIDRLANRRAFYETTLQGAAKDPSQWAVTLAKLYDPATMPRSESPVMRHAEGVIHWLRQGVIAEDPEAMLLLGQRLRKGHGVKANPVRAESLLCMAVEQGYWDAEEALMHDYKYNYIPNPTKSQLSWRSRVEKGTKQGDPIATHHLAMMLRRARGGKFDTGRALELFESAWNAGIVRSAVRLGGMHHNGEGTEKDPEQAMLWYQRAAGEGDRIGQYLVGAMLGQRRAGLQPDYVEAYKWIKLSAEQGYVKAIVRLADLHEQGRGVERDFERALQWRQMAAELGDTKAATILGRHYYHGHRVEQDYYEAMTWFRKAAEDIDVLPREAHLHIGLMYEHGLGVEPDKEEALRWYIIAGKATNYMLSDTEALFTLAKRIEQGHDGYTVYSERFDRVVGPASRDLDTDEVFHFYRLAAEHGSKKAAERLKQPDAPKSHENGF